MDSLIALDSYQRRAIMSAFAVHNHQSLNRITRYNQFTQQHLHKKKKKRNRPTEAISATENFQSQPRLGTEYCIYTWPPLHESKPHSVLLRSRAERSCISLLIFWCSSGSSKTLEAWALQESWEIDDEFGEVIISNFWFTWSQSQM